MRDQRLVLRLMFVNSSREKCTNKGHFCVPDPNEDLHAGFQGSHVIEETLRQVCVWWTVNGTITEQEKWWKYVNAFNNKCWDRNSQPGGAAPCASPSDCGKWLETCSHTQMTANAIDLAKVESVRFCSLFVCMKSRLVLIFLSTVRTDFFEPSGLS